MKRVTIVLLAAVVGGLLLFVVINHFRPVANPRRFGEIIADLACLLAIAAALDEMKRRAVNKGRPRGGAGGPPLLPDGSADAAETRTRCPRHATATLQIPPAETDCGPEPTADGEERPIVFRPYRKPMLIVALLFAGIAAFYTLVVGIGEPVPLLGILRIPGPLVVSISLAGALLYLCLFIRSCLPGREITVDTSGIILPRRRNVTWDQIDEVKLCTAGYIEFLATVRIGLNGRRRIHVAWYQTGCAPRKLYETLQAYFEEHQRRAELHRPGLEQPDGPVGPPIAAHPR